MQNHTEELTRGLRDILGYINFSSGNHDPGFFKTWNDLFRLLSNQTDAKSNADNANANANADNADAVDANAKSNAKVKAKANGSETHLALWSEFHHILLEELDRLADTPAFQDSKQAREALNFVYDKLLPAYLKFHSDTLYKKPVELIFNSFFLAHCFELVLSLGKGQFDDELVPGVIRQLNDFIGYRPIPVLEGEEKHEPDPHEWIAPLSLYRKDAGIAVGRYEKLVTLTLEILRNTDPDLLREAWFDPDKLDELVMDPRNYDFDHPVNRRPNYSFGTWDPHCIDRDGYFRRFVVHQVTVDGILQRADKFRPEDFTDYVTQDMLLYEAAAVLAGTMLMGSGVTGDHVQAHDSSVSLSTLMPIIANYRDNFYMLLIRKITGKHAEHLKLEEAKMFQPFAGARQGLNKYLAKQRADQLQRYHLARTYARMGYFEAAMEQTDIIAVASARFLCRIDCHIMEAHLQIDKSDYQSAAKHLPEIEELLHRGIACGALPDPWTLLGFGAEYSLFTSADNTIHDHRLDDLINLMNDIFDLYSRLQKEAAVHGDGELQADLSDKMSTLAGWWDQYGSDEISNVEGFSGVEVWESAAKVSTALAAWYKAGNAAGDVAFWKRHVQRFTSPKAFVLLCEALLEQNDLVASMALMMYWLSESDQIPLQEGDYSFHTTAFRWMQQLWNERKPDGRYVRDENPPKATLEEVKERWGMMTAFIDRLEANADRYWAIPTLELDPDLLDKQEDTKSPEFKKRTDPTKVKISVTPENDKIQISVQDFWLNFLKNNVKTIDELGSYVIRTLRENPGAINVGDLDKTFLGTREKELREIPDNLKLSQDIALSLFNDWITLVKDLLTEETQDDPNEEEDMLILLRPLGKLNFDLNNIPPIQQVMEDLARGVLGKDPSAKDQSGNENDSEDSEKNLFHDDADFEKEMDNLKEQIFNHYFNFDDDDEDDDEEDGVDEIDFEDDDSDEDADYYSEDYSEENNDDYPDNETENDQKDADSTKDSSKENSRENSSGSKHSSGRKKSGDLKNKSFFTEGKKSGKNDKKSDSNEENLEGENGKNNKSDSAKFPTREVFPESAEEDEDDDDVKKGIDSTFKAAYDNMTFQDSAEDGVDDEMMEGKNSGFFAGDDTELTAETDRINERLTFTYSLVKLWKYASGKTLQLFRAEENRDDVNRHLTDWLEQVCVYKIDLEKLLNQAARIRIAKPSGTPESLIEYDQQRGTKEILLDRIIWSIVDITDTILFLEAILNTEPSADENQSNSPRVQVRPTIYEFALTRDLMAALFHSDVKKARKIVPKLFKVLSNRTLLYIPTTRGGRPSDIVACRCLQQVVLRFFEYLPRLGLITETFMLLQTVQAMEQIRPSMPGAITEFDRLFETATRSLTKAVTESSKGWRIRSDDPNFKSIDDALVYYIGSTNEVLLTCWLSHSQHIRISATESFLHYPQWDRVKAFVVKYGEDLLTQHFLSFRNLRAILHQGVESWIHALVHLKNEEKEIEFGTKLIDDIIAGKLEVRHAVYYLELLFECIAENYSEYIDYNSVTTHSDHGEKTFIFLDMLRVLTSYERNAWNFKPVYWIHDTMIRSKCFSAAELWEKDFERRSSGISDETIKRYNELSDKYGVWLPSIHEKIQERLVRPLQIDRMCGMVGQAVDDVRAEVPVGAFKKLAAQIKNFTKSPMGIGFELPEWLNALQEEVMIFQTNADKCNERVTDEDILNTSKIFDMVRLKRNSLDRQLHFCLENMNFNE